jgi:hypothetical protein
MDFFLLASKNLTLDAVLAELMGLGGKFEIQIGCYRLQTLFITAKCGKL